MGPKVDPPWQQLRDAMANGQLTFKDKAAQQHAGEAYQLRDAIRRVRKSAGFKELLDPGLKPFAIAPSRSGANLAKKFNDLADAFDKILKGHEDALTDMIHVFGHKIPKEYKNAEEFSKAGFKDLKVKVGQPDAPKPMAELRGGTPGDQLPDSMRNTMYHDPGKVTGEVPRSWGNGDAMARYEKLRKFAFDLDPTIPARGWQLWNWVRNTVQGAAAAYQGGLGLMDEKAWGGSGKKAAAAATEAYSTNLGELANSILAIEGALEYIAAWVRATRDSMWNTSILHEKWVPMGTYNGENVLQQKRTVFSNLPLTTAPNFDEDAADALAEKLTAVVEGTYNGNLDKMNAQYPALPGALNPIVPQKTGPFGPGGPSGPGGGPKITPTNTTPTNDLNALKKLLTQQTTPTKKTATPRISPLTTLPTSALPTSALPTSALPTSGLPTTSPLGQASTAGLTSAADKLGQLGQSAQQAANLAGQQQPGGLPTGGLPTSGLPAGGLSPSDAAKKAAELKKGLGGSGGGGGGGKAGGLGPSTGKPLTTNLAAQNAASKLFPRAGLADALGRVGAGAGAPMAGSPGAPAAGQRGGQQGGSQEHKRADYLDSKANLDEALGEMPIVFKAVVDE